MTAAKHSFNRKAFALFLSVKVKALGDERPRELTLQEAADAAGVSKATIYRALHRQQIACENFLALCIWIGSNPFSFLIDTATGCGLAPLPDAIVSRET